MGAELASALLPSGAVCLRAVREAGTSDLQPLSASGEAVRLRVLCPGEQGGASEEVAGGHPVLDGPGAHLPPSLWARGKSSYTSPSGLQEGGLSFHYLLEKPG